MAKKVVAKFEKKVKNFDLIDMKLLKWGYITFTLFLITAWPWLRNLVLNVPWYVWLVIAVLLFIRPMKRYFSK